MERPIWHVVATTTLFLAGMMITATSVQPHGDDKHGQGEKSSKHMQAMYALKENVPEDYRIMERTPINPDAQSLARGRELFNRNCAVCHGQKGRGAGPAAKSLSTPPANFLDLEHSGIYGPGEKFWIIGNGSGERGMPAFPQIDLVDRWHLVNHIYELQKNESSKHEHRQ